MFQAALYKPAMPMNTVSSNIQYCCSSNLRQRGETKVITVFIRLLSNLYYNFKKNNTNDKKIAFHLFNFFFPEDVLYLY